MRGANNLDCLKLRETRRPSQKWVASVAFLFFFFFSRSTKQKRLPPKKEALGGSLWRRIVPVEHEPSSRGLSPAGETIRSCASAESWKSVLSFSNCDSRGHIIAPVQKSLQAPLQTLPGAVNLRSVLWDESEPRVDVQDFQDLSLVLTINHPSSFSGDGFRVHSLIPNLSTDCKFHIGRRLHLAGPKAYKAYQPLGRALTVAKGQQQHNMKARQRKDYASG